MGGMDGADHGEYLCCQRECTHLTACYKRTLPQIPSANAGCGGCKLLLRLENIHELCSQEHGANPGCDGCRFSRSVQR